MIKYLLLFVAMIAAVQDEKPWERNKREQLDKKGGVPAEILAKQKVGKVEKLSVDAAIAEAQKAADQAYAEAVKDAQAAGGKTLRVPDDYPTIGKAMEAAVSGDTVLVKVGTYFELVDLKNGVRLVSDKSDGGDELAAVEGALLKLPKRTLRTIIDGSKAQASSHGVIDFEPGSGRGTVVDGFTLQNLPKQDHHKLGHAHAVNVRGSSAMIMNCLVRKNGSTGIGNHVVYADQGQPVEKRDFRRANVKHEARAVIYRNIIHNNYGLGIGCNQFSEPLVAGNEIFANDDSELGEPTPGIGIKHGAGPRVVGNIVHNNVGGGILARVGEPMGGAFEVDGTTHPEIRSNVVFDNGKDKPGIGANGCGSVALPVRIVGNWVFRCGTVSLGLTDGATGIVRENHAYDGSGPSISVKKSVALKLEANEVAGSKGLGFAIMDKSVVWEMSDNVVDGCDGPRFALKESTIKDQPFKE